MPKTFFARSGAAGAALVVLAFASAAQASLAPSEAEQVRHEVSTAQNVGRVRALVARPDLTSSEAGAAMASAMSSTALDAPHASFLHELVFGSASAASRPVLAVAVVRGLLARADSLLAQHQADLDRAAVALAEIERAYGLVEDVAGADPSANITDSARGECARALQEHFARNAVVLRPDVAVSPAVAVVRAQAAIALLDALPDTPSRRVDVADSLTLSGVRRTTLVELGILVLDAGGPEGHLSTLRALLDRLPGAADGTEAIVIGDERASRLRARGGAVVAIEAAGGSPLSEKASPWGNETAPPPIDSATMAAARGLGVAAVRRALERRPRLRSAVEHDGGEAGVATLAAMLAVDAPRTLDAAAARLLVGKRESAAWLSDAMGALAVFAPPSKGADGLAVSLGRADPAALSTTRATRVALDAAGSATTLRLDGHIWRFRRDDGGQVSGLSRDSASAKTLVNGRPTTSEGSAWNGGGLVFARLAGSPRAAVAAGRHVWVFGSGVPDAIAAPAPSDDVAVEADLHVEGGPAGLAVRALPGSMGALGPFKGVSLLIVPGTPSQAALLVGDGFGVETAAAAAVHLAAGPVQHVRLVVRRMKVEARIGSVALEAALPEGFEHGDVALRAYSGASVEATNWNVRKP